MSVVRSCNGAARERAGEAARVAEGRGDAAGKASGVLRWAVLVKPSMLTEVEREADRSARGRCCQVPTGLARCVT